MGNAATKLMSISNIRQVLQELKSEVKRKYKAELKGVFGSRVRGEEKAGSDRTNPIIIQPRKNPLRGSLMPL